MEIKLKTKYIDCLAYIQVSLYADNQLPALVLHDVETGEILCKATVNPTIPRPDNPHETFIKNYSENEGVLEALLNANAVIDLNKSVPCGFVEANQVTLCTELADQYDKLLNQIQRR